MGLYASLTIQGLSDRFRPEVPTILIASEWERIRVWATYGVPARESLLVDR